MLNSVITKTENLVISKRFFIPENKFYACLSLLVLKQNFVLVKKLNDMNVNESNFPSFIE